MTFESATPSQGTCSQAAGVVTCALGTIADQGSASVEIKVRPQSDGTITNQASVASDEGDSNTADNSAASETTVNPAADLSLTKSDSPDPVLAGELLTYTLAVQNSGPSSAAGVTLSDTLPAGVTYESATTTQGTCSESSGTVTCELGTIADEQGVSVEIKIRSTTPGLLSNSANVVSLTADTDSADNAASAETTVTAAADLSLTKSDSPDPVLAGDELTYTLGVHNAGPQDATGVSLTDTLPAGVTFVSATPTQGSCSEASGTVSCALGTIASGADAGVEVKVTPQAAGTITNQASVTSDLADPDSADASASENTTVKVSADLALTKGDSPDPALAGELITYALSASNSGPADAAGVTLTDTLPAGVTFVSATPTQGSCSEAAGDRHLRAGHDRRPGHRRRRDQDPPLHPGHDHQRGQPHVRRTRPGLGQRLGQRLHDGERGRQPLAHEDRLARPGARRRAARLHAHRTQRGSAGRNSGDGDRHAAGWRHVRFRDTFPGQLLPSGRDR